MEPNRGNDNNQNKKPEGGDRPKNSIVTALLITVVIVIGLESYAGPELKELRFIEGDR